MMPKHLDKHRQYCERSEDADRVYFITNFLSLLKQISSLSSGHCVFNWIQKIYTGSLPSNHKVSYSALFTWVFAKSIHIIQVFQVVSNKSTKIQICLLPTSTLVFCFVLFFRGSTFFV